MRLAKENQYLLDLLKTLSNPLDPILIRAASVGDIISAKAAIRLGANVNAQDMLLQTSLHKACSSSDMQMVSFLLSNGCDSTKKNVAGKTASDLTFDPEIIKLISAYQQPRSTNVASILASPPTFFVTPSFGAKKKDGAAGQDKDYQPTVRKVVSGK